MEIMGPGAFDDAGKAIGCLFVTAAIVIAVVAFAVGAWWF
jgi:hypothetical protein